MSIGGVNPNVTQGLQQQFQADITQAASTSSDNDQFESLLNNAITGHAFDIQQAQEAALTPEQQAELLQALRDNNPSVLEDNSVRSFFGLDPIETSLDASGSDASAVDGTQTDISTRNVVDTLLRVGASPEEKFTALLNTAITNQGYALSSNDAQQMLELVQGFSQNGQTVSSIAGATAALSNLNMDEFVSALMQVIEGADPAEFRSFFEVGAPSVPTIQGQSVTAGQMGAVTDMSELTPELDVTSFPGWSVVSNDSYNLFTGQLIGSTDVSLTTSFGSSQTASLDSPLLFPSQDPMAYSTQSFSGLLPSLESGLASPFLMSDPFGFNLGMGLGFSSFYPQTISHGDQTVSLSYWDPVQLSGFETQARETMGMMNVGQQLDGINATIDAYLIERMAPYQDRQRVDAIDARLADIGANPTDPALVEERTALLAEKGQLEQQFQRIINDPDTVLAETQTRLAELREQVGPLGENPTPAQVQAFGGSDAYTAALAEIMKLEGLETRIETRLPLLLEGDENSGGINEFRDQLSQLAAYTGADGSFLGYESNQAQFLELLNNVSTNMERYSGRFQSAVGVDGNRDFRELALDVSELKAEVSILHRYSSGQIELPTDVAGLEAFAAQNDETMTSIQSYAQNVRTQVQNIERLKASGAIAEGYGNTTELNHLLTRLDELGTGSVTEEHREVLARIHSELNALVDSPAQAPNATGYSESIIDVLFDSAFDGVSLDNPSADPIGDLFGTLSEHHTLETAVASTIETRVVLENELRSAIANLEDLSVAVRSDVANYPPGSVTQENLDSIFANQQALQELLDLVEDGNTGALDNEVGIEQANALMASVLPHAQDAGELLGAVAPGAHSITELANSPNVEFLREAMSQDPLPPSLANLDPVILAEMQSLLAHPEDFVARVSAMLNDEDINEGNKEMFRSLMGGVHQILSTVNDVQTEGMTDEQKTQAMAGALTSIANTNVWDNTNIFQAISDTNYLSMEYQSNSIPNAKSRGKWINLLLQTAGEVQARDGNISDRAVLLERVEARLIERGKIEPEGVGLADRYNDLRNLNDAKNRQAAALDQANERISDIRSQVTNEAGENLSLKLNNLNVELTALERQRDGLRGSYQAALLRIERATGEPDDADLAIVGRFQSLEQQITAKRAEITQLDGQIETQVSTQLRAEMASAREDMSAEIAHVQAMLDADPPVLTNQAVRDHYQSVIDNLGRIDSLDAAGMLQLQNDLTTIQSMSAFYTRLENIGDGPFPGGVGRDQYITELNQSFMTEVMGVSADDEGNFVPPNAARILAIPDHLEDFLNDHPELLGTTPQMVNGQPVNGPNGQPVMVPETAAMVVTQVRQQATTVFQNAIGISDAEHTLHRQETRDAAYTEFEAAMEDSVQDPQQMGSMSSPAGGRMTVADITRGYRAMRSGRTPARTESRDVLGGSTQIFYARMNPQRQEELGSIQFGNHTLNDLMQMGPQELQDAMATMDQEAFHAGMAILREQSEQLADRFTLFNAAVQADRAEDIEADDLGSMTYEDIQAMGETRTDLPQDLETRFFDARLEHIAATPDISISPAELRALQAHVDSLGEPDKSESQAILDRFSEEAAEETASSSPLWTSQGMGSLWNASPTDLFALGSGMSDFDDAFSGVMSAMNVRAEACNNYCQHTERAAALTNLMKNGLTDDLLAALDDVFDKQSPGVDSYTDANLSAAAEKNAAMLRAEDAANATRESQIFADAAERVNQLTAELRRDMAEIMEKFNQEMLANMMAEMIGRMVDEHIYAVNWEKSIEQIAYHEEALQAVATRAAQLTDVLSNVSGESDAEQFLTEITSDIDAAIPLVNQINNGEVTFSDLSADDQLKVTNGLAAAAVLASLQDGLNPGSSALDQFTLSSSVETNSHRRFDDDLIAQLIGRFDANLEAQGLQSPQFSPGVVFDPLSMQPIDLSGTIA